MRSSVFNTRSVGYTEWAKYHIVIWRFKIYLVVFKSAVYKWVWQSIARGCLLNISIRLFQCLEFARQRYRSEQNQSLIEIGMFPARGRKQILFKLARGRVNETRNVSFCANLKIKKQRKQRVKKETLWAESSFMNVWSGAELAEGAKGICTTCSPFCWLYFFCFLPSWVSDSDFNSGET